MGIVWLARDEELEREVALKFLPDLMIQDRAVFDQLKRETKRCLELTHPHIVRIHDFVHDQRSGCISMEYIDGETLSNLRAEKEQKVFEPDEIAIWTGQLCDALDYAHNHAKIIHRDLKPGNLMVSQRGDLKVSDFGIARSLADSVSRLTMEQGPSGTLVYMSPQQLDGEGGSHLDDIYSLGATIYDLLTSKPPFYSGNIDRQIHERVAPSMTERRKEFDIEPALVPQVWEDAVAACLAKDPSRRPQSAAEVAQRLQLAQPRTGTRIAPSKSSNRKALLVGCLAALSVLVLAGVYFGLLKRQAVPVSQTAAIPKKSIAVLPFENRSEELSNAYFADAIQDEVLTRLSKISDLKVISRTSTLHYKTAPQNLREIAKQLGVAHIMEGSVQKSGDSVRVNVQLINPVTDTHIWADTFDRSLTDIFSVETDIAKSIVEQLQAKLTGRESQLISTRTTDNAVAYDSYLRGLAYTVKPGNTSTNLINAQKYFKEAVQLDPKFALSWAQLSYVDAIGYISLKLEPTAELREEARHAADMALSLQPGLGEAYYAQGYYQYACLKDYGTAVRYFEEARRLLPNSSRVPEALAYVARRRGNWERSEAYFIEAERLDPRNASLLTSHAHSYVTLRRFSEAIRKFDDVLDITPDDPDILAGKAAVAQAMGDLPRASTFLSMIPLTADGSNVLRTQAYQAILERNPIRVTPRFKDLLTTRNYGGDLLFWLGWAQKLSGQEETAKITLQQARSELEPALRQRPDDLAIMGDLALVNVVLGDKSVALSLAERSMSTISIEKDALIGPEPVEIFARVAAQAGQHDRSIAALEKLIRLPYAGPLPENLPLTPALLRLDPMFDPLRGNPRFEKLAASDAWNKTARR
jgi:serine/threonine protein kinase/Flp pilus assembly protein TadD